MCCASQHLFFIQAPFEDDRRRDRAIGKLERLTNIMLTLPPREPLVSIMPCLTMPHLTENKPNQHYFAFAGVAI